MLFLFLFSLWFETAVGIKLFLNRLANHNNIQYNILL